MEKRLRISVEDSKIKDLKRSASELAQNMISSSRQYTTSSKEVLRDLEDQIKLIEKRTKLDKESRIEATRMSLGAGTITKEDSAKKIGQIRSESGTDKLQISLLREVIDTIKSTAKDEIRENRSSVEKRIRSSKTVSALAPSGDAMDILKETIQRGLLGDIGQGEIEEGSKFKKFGRFSRGASGAFNTASGLATSKNEMYALAGLVGLTPMVGQGLSNIATRLLSSGATAEGSMEQFAGTTIGGISYGRARREWDKIKGSGTGVSLGLDPSELMMRQAAIGKTMGAFLPRDRFLQTMGAERFVGSENIGRLAGASRYGQGDIDQVIRLLKNNSDSTTRLTENIDTYVQASSQILGVSSSVNEQELAKTIAGIQSATGTSGRNLTDVTQALGGLGKGGNPMIRSMMMQSFRRSNPNASVFELQAMMENPLASLGEGGGTSGFLNNLRDVTGGGDTFKQALFSAFGGQLSRSKIQSISESGDITKIASEINRVQSSTTDFEKEAAKSIGIEKKSTAITDAEFQQWGLETLETAKDAVTEMKKLYEKLANLDEIFGTDKIVESVNKLNENSISAYNAILLNQGFASGMNWRRP